jgi:hypothetical protein
MPLALLQSIVLGASSALLIALALLGTHQTRKVAGVDCARVEARAGHVSPWEREACR